MKKYVVIFILFVTSFPSMAYEFHSALYYPELEMIERAIEDLEFHVSVHEMEIAELKEIIEAIDTFRQQDKRLSILEHLVKKRVAEEVNHVLFKAVVLCSTVYAAWWLWNR